MNPENNKENSDKETIKFNASNPSSSDPDTAETQILGTPSRSSTEETRIFESTESRAHSPYSEEGQWETRRLDPYEAYPVDSNEETYSTGTPLKESYDFGERKKKSHWLMILFLILCALLAVLLLVFFLVQNIFSSQSSQGEEPVTSLSTSIEPSPSEENSSDNGEGEWTFPSLPTMPEFPSSVPLPTELPALPTQVQDLQQDFEDWQTRVQDIPNQGRQSVQDAIDELLGGSTTTQSPDEYEEGTSPEITTEQ